MCSVGNERIISNISKNLKKFWNFQLHTLLFKIKVSHQCCWSLQFSQTLLWVYLIISMRFSFNLFATTCDVWITSRNGCRAIFKARLTTGIFKIQNLLFIITLSTLKQLSDSSQHKELSNVYLPASLLSLSYTLAVQGKRTTPRYPSKRCRNAWPVS